jgi:molybdopterin converting factor small subunit
MAPALTLRLPPTLAQFCDGERVVAVAGTTVGEALASAAAAHPLLRAQLMDERGRVRPNLHLFLNEQDVRTELDTPVRGGDELLVLRAMSGG